MLGDINGEEISLIPGVLKKENSSALNYTKAEAAAGERELRQNPPIHHPHEV